MCLFRRQLGSSLKLRMLRRKLTAVLLVRKTHLGVSQPVPRARSPPPPWDSSRLKCTGQRLQSHGSQTLGW